MSSINSYDVLAPTTTAEGVAYSSSTTTYPAATASLPAGNYYQSNVFMTITTTTFLATASQATSVGENRDWSGSTSGPTANQGAIIALGVVCGLLTISFVVLLICMFYLGWRHQKEEKVAGGLTITPGYQAMARHKHRHDRTAYSRGGTDDMTDYLTRHDGLNIPRKHGRSYRRSQPVTSEEFDGISRAEINPAQWGNSGMQPQSAAYTHFPNLGASVYFPQGQGNRQAVPMVQGPINGPAPQQQRRRDGESAGEPSEVSSSSQEEIRGSGHRQSSVQRYDSKASSSARGRPGRNL